MNKKHTIPVVVLALLSLVLSACGGATPTAAPTAIPTAVPTVAPSEAPPPPEPETDFQVLFTQLVAEIPADAGYGTVTPAKLNEELAEKPPFLLDVRETAEVEKDGYILGSVNIPVRNLLDNLDRLPAQDQPIVVLCASGHRGGFAMAALKMLGYTDVRNLAGGLGAWKKAELAVEIGMPAAPAAGTAPQIADEALYNQLKEWFAALPDGFYATKADVLNTDLADGKELFLLDVRRADEYAKNGYIAGATNLPLEELFDNLDELPAKDTDILVYCVSGHRGSIATMGLSLLGYENVINLGGGFNAWKAAGFALEGVVDWNTVWADFLAGMPDNYYTISPADLNLALGEEPPPFIVDIREPAELEKDGYIQFAYNLPVRTLLDNLDKLPAQDQPIVVYCASGHRGALAMAALRMLGYTDVRNLNGGTGAWVKAALPLEPAGLPEAAPSISNPNVDAMRLEALKTFMANLPDGFYSVKSADLNIALGEEVKPFVLDVRSAAELEADGVIESSLNIPIRELFTRLSELPQDRAAKIVVLCKSGHRGGVALMALRMIGYTDVSNLAGGINAWIAAELPVVKPQPVN